MYGYRRRSKPHEEKEVLRIEITDCIGNELSPGMIVAYSAGAKLKFGVYEGVAKMTTSHGNSRYRLQLCTARNNRIRRQVIGMLSYEGVGQFSAPENTVVVKNPLYHLGSTSVAECLQAIDRLKDEGHLEDDFKAR
jgi:hypothetical protein